MFKTPIVFFNYKRPETTTKVINELNKINYKKIYIVCDGWKNNKDKKKVIKVRNLIDKTIKKGSIKKLYFNQNIGIKNIIPKGLNWVFNFEKKVIILEDDTVPNKTFFYFCDQLLTRFEKNKKISMICGSNYNSDISKTMKESYFFSKYSFIWGWATWKDRYISYDKHLNNWDKYKASNRLKNEFKNLKELKFWNKYFNLHKKNPEFGAWDFPLTFTNFYLKRYSVIPKKNLISNIGYENPTGYNPNKAKKLKTLRFNLKLIHPSKIRLNLKYDEFCSKHLFSMPNLKFRIKNKLKKLFYDFF